MASNSPAKQFIMRNSGGMIRDENQAMLVIIIVFILSVVFSGILLYRSFSPAGRTIIEEDPSFEVPDIND